MRTRQNVLYTINNEALYIYVVRFVNKPPGDCPRLRFDLFDSCARYKFSSFIHSFIQTIVLPILNKNNLNTDTATSYRPISNQPYISKVSERVIAKRPSSSSVQLSADKTEVIWFESRGNVRKLAKTTIVRCASDHR